MYHKDVAKKEKSSWIEQSTDIVHRLFKSLPSNETTITKMSLVIAWISRKKKPSLTEVL